MLIAETAGAAGPYSRYNCTNSLTQFANVTTGLSILITIRHLARYLFFTKDADGGKDDDET
jgi:hypothetical protein